MAYSFHQIFLWMTSISLQAWLNVALANRRNPSIVVDVVPLAWHLPLLDNVCYNCWDNYELVSTFCLYTVISHHSSPSSQEASKDCSYSANSGIGWEKSTCPWCRSTTRKGRWGRLVQECPWSRLVWLLDTCMPTYCRCSQLGFVHVWEVGKNTKAGGDHSCESLLHRPKGDAEKVREFNFVRLDTLTF